MRSLLVVPLLLVAFTATASAQATRTFVSGVGDDANPCSRTAPCKTFGGTISKTAANGEIDVLDPGSFGAVTITKGITLDGGGTLAAILASGSPAAVIINAPGATVVLRNLSLNGTGQAGNGMDGIRTLAAAAVHIENCVISNFAQYGIDVENGADVFVHDTTIRRVVAGAIRAEPASGTARLMLDGVRLEQSGYGLRVAPGAVAVVRDSVAAGNVVEGWWADGAGAALSLTGSVAMGNAIGVRASTNAVVRTLGVTVTDNTTDGLLADGGGAIVGFTDNQTASNGTAETCEVDAATAVACPSGTASMTCPQPMCPQAICPQAICPAPPVGSATQKCKRCRTRRGVTSCTQCTVQLP